MIFSKDFRPKARPDVAVVPRGDGGKHVLESPGRGRYFLIGEDEQRLLSWMDGRHTLAELRERFERETACVLGEGALEGLVVQFDRLGLLEGAPPPSEPPRVQGSLLCVRFRLFNPDRLVAGLARAFRPVFTAPAVVAMLAVIGAGLFAFQGRAGSLAASLGGYGWTAIPAFWLTLVAVAFLHELGHAVTCAHFGGRVREMGAMLLLLFVPCLYVNLSSAWMFHRRAERLWVTAAGVLFEGFVWSVAVLALATFEVPEPFRFVALSVAAVTGLDMLFNLNPLIKLDGYYLLSDLLEIPNLRTRAFHYVAEAVLGRARPEVPRRERVVYLIYAPLSLAFTLSILMSMTYAVGCAAYVRFGWILAVPVWAVFGYVLVRTMAQVAHSVRLAWNGVGRQS